jgi:uncharacterized protein YkwD
MSKYGNNNNPNTFTETIEEIDPRTGAIKRTTRTVIKSSNMKGESEHFKDFGNFENFGNFGDFGDFSDFGNFKKQGYKDDDDPFKKYGKQNFSEEYEEEDDAGNKTVTKKVTKYATVNHNDDNFGDDDFQDYMKKYNNQSNDIKSSSNKENNSKHSSSSRNRDYDNFNNNKKPFDLNTFRNVCLKQHNVYRRNHKVNDLKENFELNSIAQKYAEKLASTSSFSHSGASFHGDPLGENLFMQGGRPMIGEMAADSWYDEIKDYNFKNPDSSSGVVGHFTQLVWKDSEEIGIGCAQSRDGAYYVVANYFPAGNYIGEETENVFPK